MRMRSLDFSLSGLLQRKKGRSRLQANNNSCASTLRMKMRSELLPAKDEPFKGYEIANLDEEEESECSNRCGEREET